MFLNLKYPVCALRDYTGEGASRQRKSHRGLWRAKDMESWGSRIAVAAEYPIFRNMKHGLTIKEKWGILMSDLLGILSMVHLRLGIPPAKLER